MVGFVRHGTSPAEPIRVPRGHEDPGAASPSSSAGRERAGSVWRCLTHSASDSRKVRDVFGVSLFGFESCVKSQNSASDRPSCIVLILCCNFI